MFPTKMWPSFCMSLRLEVQQRQGHGLLLNMFKIVQACSSIARLCITDILNMFEQKMSFNLHQLANEIPSKLALIKYVLGCVSC